VKETTKRPLVNTGLQTLAQLEEAISVWKKNGKNCRVIEEGIRNMEAMCKLVEKWMYATEKDMEENFAEWEEEMEVRCNAMIGTMVLAEQELKRKHGR
jgi:hypothetical protein